MLLFLQLHHSGEKITLLLVTVDGTKTHIHALKKKTDSNRREQIS